MLNAVATRLLVAQSDLNAVAAKDLQQIGVTRLTHYIEWDDITTGGQVTIETAPTADYAGTWAPVENGVINWNGANRVDVVYTDRAFIGIRHRITQAVTSGPGHVGTVTTRIVGAT